jgi:hypothetical protein
MGNASSVQLVGEATGGVSQHQPVDVSIHSSTKSWATMVRRCQLLSADMQQPCTAAGQSSSCSVSRSRAEQLACMHPGACCFEPATVVSFSTFNSCVC